MASSGTTSTRKRFTGAEFIVHFLEQQGIKIVTGIPGGSIPVSYTHLNALQNAGESQSFPPYNIEKSDDNHYRITPVSYTHLCCALPLKMRLLPTSCSPR